MASEDATEPHGFCAVAICGSFASALSVEEMSRWLKKSEQTVDLFKGSAPETRLDLLDGAVDWHS